jgi:hypothetical protein
MMELNGSCSGLFDVVVVVVVVTAAAAAAAAVVVFVVGAIVENLC